MPFTPGQSGNAETQFQPGVSGNPAGKPKGALHLSTHIQNMLNDPEFMPDDVDDKVKGGTPMKAIVYTAVKNASKGDTKWAEWLGKYGYGVKSVLSNDPDAPVTEVIPATEEMKAKFLKFMLEDTKG